jgi:hypothetical protein
MKFSKLIKGITDVRPVELTLPGADAPITVGLRPLTAWEESDVTARATTFAKTKGVEKPDERDYQFVLGVWTNTLLTACQAFTDLEFPAEEGSPAITYKKGEPIFGNVDEILQGLDRDRISYLFEMQQRIQEDHGMRKERMTQEEMLVAVHQIATSEVGDADLPFWKWGPSLRANFMHFTACMLYFSRLDKSPSGTSSESSETNVSKTNPE